MNKAEEFKNFLKFSRYEKSFENSKKILNKQIGFSREKERFLDYIFLYPLTEGNFFPEKEITCYFGQPGVGKTSFVKTLSESMSRKLITISCSGLKDFSKFSISGKEKNKKSFVYWLVEEAKCVNPIILFDELEKVEEKSKIQEELMEFFQCN